MAQNIIILLTEGDHDAAFLYRILKANGITKFTSLIKDFPSPLNKLLAADIINVSIPEVNIQTARTRFLPSNVVKKDDNIILIYAIQGDSRADIRVKLIEAFNNFNTNDSEEIQVVEETTIAALYFLDADDLGIQYRLDQINEELRTAFEGVAFDVFTENSTIKIVDDILVGAHIFVEAGTEKGKLEDILIPMMKSGNEDIFGIADCFLSIHEDTNLFKGKVKYDTAGKKNKVYGDKYYPEKSLIGTVGQLHKSGKSNTVCISDSNYLTDEKIIASPVCIQIFEFISSALK
jgi:hypothetical protein